MRRFGMGERCSVTEKWSNRVCSLSIASYSGRKEKRVIHLTWIQLKPFFSANNLTKYPIVKSDNTTLNLGRHLPIGAQAAGAPRSELISG